MKYVIRDPSGAIQAVHERIEAHGGKAFRWWTAGPDGRLVGDLQGRSSKDLPLFGSQHVRAWDSSRPIFVTEGEKDCLALATAGHRALGIVTGAPTCHNPDAFAVLRGHRVYLWPDRDVPGAELMLKAARALEPVAASVLWLDWTNGPPGGGAADFLAAGLNLDDLLLTAGHVPVPPPAMRREGNRRVPWRQVSLAPSHEVAPLARAVRQAGQGNRNALLFWAAHKAADGGIPRELAEGELLDAFLSDEPSPIRQREGRATIRSAYRP